MKLSIPTKILAVAVLSSTGAAFQLQYPTITRGSSWRHPSTSVSMSTPSPDDMRRIMEEESMNPATLAESAERMKNMTPEVGLLPCKIQLPTLTDFIPSYN